MLCVLHARWIFKAQSALWAWVSTTWEQNLQRVLNDSTHCGLYHLLLLNISFVHSVIVLACLAVTDCHHTINFYVSLIVRQNRKVDVWVNMQEVCFWTPLQDVEKAVGVSWWQAWVPQHTATPGTQTRHTRRRMLVISWMIADGCMMKCST